MAGEVEPTPPGRPSTVTRNGITTTLSRNDAGQLTGESYSGDSLNGLSVVNTYDSATLRQQEIRTLNGATSLITNSYVYDDAGRLETASEENGVNSLHYAFGRAPREHRWLSGVARPLRTDRASGWSHSHWAQIATLTILILWPGS